MTCGGSTGVIEVTMNSKGGDTVFALTPTYTDVDSPISWSCGTANADHYKYVPTECRKAT